MGRTTQFLRSKISGSGDAYDAKPRPNEKTSSWIISHWIISQRWSELLFINFTLPVDEITPLLPQGLEVDTLDGRAFVSIVPFRMSKVRFPFSPILPGSNLEELNIRTYVKRGNQRGIFFITLDTNHWLASIIARTFFHLPYRHSKMKLSAQQNKYSFESPDFNIQATIGSPLYKDKTENWITERYHLFTPKKDELLQGTAIHPPWQLNSVHVEKIDNRFLQSFGIENAHFHSIFYGRELEVRFPRFKECPPLESLDHNEFHKRGSKKRFKKEVQKRGSKKRFKKEVIMNKLTILYDGACHLCFREVNHYLKRDQAKNLNPVDISDASFDPTKYGLSSEDVNLHMHAIDDEGTVFVGVDCFYQIWKRLPVYNKLSPILGKHPLRPVIDLGYDIFARYIRPNLPKRRCDDGQCSI